MEWVKATDRLPENGGKENKVVVKWKGYVAWGFRNFSDDPKMYIEIGSKSFLEKKGVEWLDETSTIK